MVSFSTALESKVVHKPTSEGSYKHDVGAAHAVIDAEGRDWDELRTLCDKSTWGMQPVTEVPPHCWRAE